MREESEGDGERDTFLISFSVAFLDTPRVPYRSSSAIFTRVVRHTCSKITIFRTLCCLLVFPLLYSCQETLRKESLSSALASSAD